MSDGEPWSWTASALAQALERGAVSAREAVQSCLARIEATGSLGAWLAVDREGALAQAEAADQRRRAGGRLSPLDGVPVGIKDNIMARGTRTTCASRLLEGFVSPYDATVVARLKDAGAVLVGKLNMDEFAMGSSNEHSAFGPVANPWDRGRVAGGSSGGSAAAVAACAVPASLGSDTGGSIRQPAAFCGVVGLKPTYGRVSRHGLVAYASSLDQVGPIARSVADCAQVMALTAGADPLDATSSREPVAPAWQAHDGGLRGRRLGVPREYFAAGAEPEVRRLVERALADLAHAGAELVDVSLPHTDLGIATYYILATAEASSNLARYDGVRYGHRAAAQGLREMTSQSRSQGFGAEVQRRILLGTFVLSSRQYDAYFARAQASRQEVARDFTRAFASCDVLVTPTSPEVAFPLGSPALPPARRYLADVYTVGANLAGLPALSLPCGRTEAGLPVGLQLIAPAFAEGLLFEVGGHLEQLRAPGLGLAPC